MHFDYKEYSEAMDDFLLKMERLYNPAHSDIEDALARICRFLEIAKVDMVYYESARQEAQNKGEIFVFYAQETADDAHRIPFREEEPDGAITIYRIYPFTDGRRWSQIELEKIALLSKMLYVYNGRLHVTRLAKKLVYRDPDLSIYNLSYFLKYCEEKIAQGDIGSFTACYFNLKRFSSVNQQLGRKKATEIMADFIHSLQKRLENDEIVCRIGGDSFIALFHKEHISIIMDYLQGMGLLYDKETASRIFINTTAGYYPIPGDTQITSDIMDNVGLAYNLAKNVLGEPYLIFDNKMAENIKESKALEELFPEALENEEFEVYYQPKVSLKNYTLAGAEALCRWFHDGEMIMPYRFIPVFEQSKSVTMLDFYMLEHVCRDLRKWLDEGKQIVKISVNMSRRHLGDMDLLDRILTVIDGYRIPHEYIEIELTETTTDVDFKDLRQIVTGLQSVGIQTSVDDFGIGYSSLNLIRELPWNVLKIDKSFLNTRGNSENNGNIMLGHVISMAQEIGLECIVEGVETADQIKLLKENNCYLAQGFFFDQPLPREEFEQRLNGIQ